MRLPLLAALLLVAAIGPAAAGTPYTVKMRCPIGGERFNYTATASYSTWGSRPDGRPYGSWIFPMPLPECPGNGLVLYKEEFTRQEKTRLAALIADPAYRAMRATETPYYRAQWLMRRMEPGTIDATWTLLQAVWEAEDGSSQRARYLREFADEATAVPSSAENWKVLQFRVANARRELGEFEAASALLRALILDPPAPASTEGLSEDERYAADDAAEEAQAMIEFRARLLAAITRRDASMEPLDLLPPREAAARCLAFADVLTAPAPAPQVCTSPEVAEDLEAMREFQRED